MAPPADLDQQSTPASTLGTVHRVQASTAGHDQPPASAHAHATSSQSHDLDHAPPQPLIASTGKPASLSFNKLHLLSARIFPCTLHLRRGATASNR